MILLDQAVMTDQGTLQCGGVKLLRRQGDYLWVRRGSLIARVHKSQVRFIKYRGNPERRA